MDIFQSLVQIQNLWLTLGQIESIETTPKGHKKRKIKTIQSRAFIITDRLGQLRLDGCIDVEKFVFRPGKVFGQFLFGPGRQTALLSARALSYNTHREIWEKRLTRYLSWHWRANNVEHSSHYAIETLLNTVDPKWNDRFSSKVRDRLEKALDKLQEDFVIEGWSYVGSPESMEICVLPPPAHRTPLTLLAATEAALPQETRAHQLGSQVRERRKTLRLSQSTLAQQLEITQAYLSMLENGKTGARHLNTALSERIYKWLAEA
jgi:DNA-binding XRE family transcriptional regulator